MEHTRAVNRLFLLFISLSVLGVAQFIVANIVSLQASLLLGSAGLILWGAVAIFLVVKGGLWEGFPRWTQIPFSIAAVLLLWFAFLPPYFRDDLIIHLELPKWILRAGEWRSIPFQATSRAPNLLTPLTMILVNSGFDGGAKIIPGLFGIASALLLAHWTAASYGGKWGAFSALALLTVPVLFRLSTTSYNDPAVMFFSCAGACFFFRYYRSGRFVDGLKGGVSFAAGAAIKYNAGLMLVAVLASLFALPREGKGFLRMTMVFFAASAAVLVFCGPWWLRFSGEGHPSPPAQFKGPIHERMVMCRESAPYALAAPIRIFFQGRDGDGCRFDGELNPFFLPLGIGLLFAFRRREHLFLGVSALLFIALASLLFTLTARYFFPVVPTLVFLSTALLASFAAGGWKTLAYCLAGPLLVANFWGYGKAARSFNGWRYLLGQETRPAFLEKNVPHYRASLAANDNVRKGTVYFAFVGNQVYYSTVNYYYDPFWDGQTLMKLFTERPGAREISSALASRGFSHLLFRKDFMERFIKGNRFEQKYADLRNLYSRTLYEDEHTALIAIVPGQGSDGEI